MEVKLIKKTKSRENIYYEKLKVAAYARVSTKLEKQSFSLESQIKYYTDYIIRNNNWQLVKVFADDGISGRNLKNRDTLIEMLNEAMRGNIDLILTKSVSRFARNTYNLLNVVRKLKERGVTIIFEEENINTSTLEWELLLSVLGAAAQTESENIGEHVKLGQAMIWKSGKDFKVENNHLDSKDSIYSPILDFVSNQHFFVYDDTGERRKKTLITKVRVRVEIEQ